MTQTDHERPVLPLQNPPPNDAALGWQALATAASAEIVWTACPDGWMTAASDWEAATGLPPATVLGRGWLDGLHPEDRPRAEAAWAAATAGRGAVPYDLELRFRAPDGSWCWRHMRGTPVHDPASGAVREWIGLAQDIDARRRAEVANAAGEAAWRALVEAVPGLVFVADAAGRIVFTSGRYQAYVGVQAEALLGKGWMASLHPDDRTRAAALWADGVGRGEPYEAEYRLLRADGTPRWHLVRAAPQCDPDTGHVARWVGTATNIDDHRRAEATDARLAAIVVSSHDAIISFAPEDGRILTWNRAAERLFGYTAAEAVGQPVGLLVPPELPEGEPTGVFRWALEGRPVQEHETLRLHKSGARIPIAVTAARMLAPDGRVLGISGVFRDLRPRRAAEAAARTAEARARLALRAGGLVAWEIEAEPGRIVTEEGLAALFGLPPEALDGTMQPFVAHIHPEDRARVLSEFAPAAQDIGGSYRSEFRLLPDPAESEPRWLLGAGEGVPGPDGRVHVVGYNADITACKQAEAALHEALEVREALLAEVNHRVKNSLQLVSSLLSLQAARADTAATRAALDEARGRIGVVARLHQRLYRSGRHDAVDLIALLRELCGDAGALLAGTGRIRVVFAPPAEAPELVLPIDRAVPAALIAAELLTNALKYAYPEGGPGGEIRVRAQREAADPVTGTLVLTVEDDGVGLPDGVLPAASRGVGMRVVTTLVRQLRAGFAARPGAGGRGAAFELRLPERGAS